MFFGKMEIITEPISFNDCKTKCEIFARDHMKITYVDLNSAWFSNAKLRQPTPKQKIILDEYGAYQHGMSNAEATLKIQTIFAHSNKEKRVHGNALTLAQRAYLEHLGVHVNSLTKREAFLMIQRMKQTKQGVYEHHT